MTKNYIAGEWVAASEASPEHQPVEHRRRAGRVRPRLGGRGRAAIAAAKDAFPAWSRSSIQTRHDILKAVGDEILARKDELGRLLSREEGKTLPEGIGEVDARRPDLPVLRRRVPAFAGDKVPSVRPGVDVEITREPVGVVGLITPWNFPIAIPAWKIAPALAYGNCVVFKPADLVPGSAQALAEIIIRAGVPAGVFNLVMGRGSVVGEAHAASPEVSAISFTGSVRPAARSPQPASPPIR